ncbi:MAG: hypothetical protein ACKVJK_22450, partial [Methylophagaceae bacterium]
RLAGVVKDIRTVQIPALKARELTMLDKINEVRQTESPVISTARDEIQRLRESAEAQVANSQTLIERLRGQLAQTDKTVEIDEAVDEQGERIKTANAEIEILTEQKYELEGEYRQLEAEVGPIKYIAEFVYGEQADKNMLEKAVTWVIVIIIFVFDPLAVLLLIASQYTFDFARKNKGISNDRARMQKIVDNPGPKDPDEKIEVPKFEDVDQETIDKEFAEDKIAQSYMDATPEEEVPVQKKSIEFSEGSSNKDIPDTANRMFYQEELNESTASYNKFTEEQLDELDNLPDWADAKQRWKDENPNETLKEAKKKYLHGIIDELPWQKYVISPGLTEDVIQTGYIQNQEQKENSLWKTIGDK